jgi:aminoglycoside phosphotransferase (APT) family kinase protein
MSPSYTELDIEDPVALVRYLRETGRIGTEESPEIRVLKGGVSNRTVHVARRDGEAWVLKQALRRLRVEVEWLSAPERIGREALGMRWLAELLPQGSVPALVFEDSGPHLLAMTAVPEPHRSWKSMLLAGELDFDHVRQFAEMLRAMHRGSAARREEAAAVFGDTTFFETLRLEPYYEYTATRIPGAAAFLRGVVQENRTNRVCIVHGDYSPKNILVHNGRLVLLDHEVIHFGDPAFDIGFAMTHLLSKAHHVAEHRARFTEAAALFWGTYEDGGPIESRCVRNTLACLLARVDGRSPLEYLTEEERSRQRKAVLHFMAQPPITIPDLIDEFLRNCR